MKAGYECLARHISAARGTANRHMRKYALFAKYERHAKNRSAP